MKRIEFLGTSRADLQDFPAAVRVRLGHELYLVQEGDEPSDFKPMPMIGPGTYEIRVRNEAGAFRIAYVAKFRSTIYVLHAFQKKTQKTASSDIELARQRYRSIKEMT